MPDKHRIIVRLIGSDVDAGDVRLSDFLEQLEAIESALKQTERLLSGLDQASIYYKVVDLGHSSPATVTLEPSHPVGRKPPIRPERVTTSFTRSIARLKRAKRPPKGMTLEALEAYKSLGSTLGKHVQRIEIIEPSPDPKQSNVIPIDRALTEKIDELIGPDVMSDGSVSGFLEQVNLHNTARFNIYPTARSGRVRCNFDKSKLERVKQALDCFVTVIGTLRYKNWNQHPHAIDVDDIDIHEPDDKLPSIFDLHGSSPDATGNKKSEDFVRKLRNANW